jgi:ABC-2 type transport system permease protein
MGVSTTADQHDRLRHAPLPDYRGEWTLLRPSAWSAMWALCRREITRFFRQRNRVIGALGQPILFWLLFGVGLQRSFRVGSEAEQAAAGIPSFLEYYFPGTLFLVLLFTAIFTTISIIEDRREGFLQGVLVAPIPRWSMVLGKVLGGALIATGQGAVFLLLAWSLRVELSLATLLSLILFLLVCSIALTSLGFVMAWRMESTQGFHAIMNLVLMPMWLLSGAFFPVPALIAGSDPGQWLMHWAMRLNPITYCVAGVRQMLFDYNLGVEFWAPRSLLVCWSVAVLFAICAFGAAVRTARKRVQGEYQ